MDFLLLIAFLLFSIVVLSQSFVSNPSFEGPTGGNTVPPQWTKCKGTPDVLPLNVGGPVVPPSQGNSCLGMVISFPGIEETVSQVLADTLDSLSCYSFTIDLRYIPTYLSVCNPGRARIWLGDSICDRQFLSWTSPIITHGTWRTYTASIFPVRRFTSITLDLIYSSRTPENVCMAIDNINNQVVVKPVDLGNDTTLCTSDSLLLDPNRLNSSYLWQDNSTDSVFKLGSPGLYWVEVTDLIAGCVSRDSIIVDYEPELFLGNDTSLCGGDSLLLSSNLGNIPGLTYLWQDNSQQPTLFAKDSAWYSLTTTSNFCTQTDSILIDTEDDPQLDLGPDTVLCIGQLLTIDATVPNANSYVWSNASTLSQISVAINGNYKVTVTVGSCEYVDSIEVRFENLQAFSLIPDETICDGDSITLNGPAGNGYQYKWQDNSTTQNFVAKQPGKYWLDVSIGNCIESDTFELSISNFNSSLSNLKDDTVLCDASNILLDATAAGATSYLWQDASTNPTFLATQAGTFKVTVSDGTCSYVDSTEIRNSTLTPFSLGADTTLCPGERLRISAPINSNYTYSWQDASDTTFYIVRADGKYWVDVMEGACTQTDTIEVLYNNFDPLQLDLGKDTTICPRDTLLLDATVSWGDSYLWQDASTSPTLKAFNPIKYKVIVSAGECTVSNSISISLTSLQTFDLGPDTTLCLNDSIILKSPNAAGHNYSWQNGSSVPSFIIRQDGLYWLTTQFGKCTFADTIQVDYINISTPIINLGKDSLLCEGDELVIDATYLNTATYLWNNGSTSPTQIASGLIDSTYAVEVFNGPCIGRDTIRLGGIPRPRLLSKPDFLCIGESLDLVLAPDSGTHTWQDGSQGRVFQLSDSGRYFVQTVNQHCIFNEDTLNIGIDDCECIPTVPNIFTPNNDGINDRLELKTENCDFDQFEFAVYNRFGKRVFISSTPNYTWNGRSREDKVNHGAYFYILKYGSKGSAVKTVEGTITLSK